MYEHAADNQAAQTTKCSVCFQTFQGTAKQPLYVLSLHFVAWDKLMDRLQQHIDGKHGDKKDKKFADFFPGYVAA